jgi:hypothetical protein
MARTFKPYIIDDSDDAETCGLYYKQVTIVIYDRNDIGLYYKTRDDHNWRS